MDSLLYLYKTSFKNRVKKALHKPVTYVYIIGIIAYLIMMGISFGTMFKDVYVDSPVGLASILTAFVFFTVPSNVIAYTKRKGLLYTKSDVHFVFPSPQNPKFVLLYAQLKQMLMGLGFGILLVGAGIFIFHTAVWKMLLYFIFAIIIENMIEAAIMVILYGNEVLSNRTMRIINLLMYCLLASFVVIAFLMVRQDGITVANIMKFLQVPFIQFVPIVGWNIAVIHLIIVGPTTVNVVCSILYLISAVVLILTAIRMKCTGEYYEDAMKFADDYEEARRRGKKGEVAYVGKKQKFGKASITYKGYYAKAIFYRQLLEYKKNRFFIFGMMTLVCLGIGIGIAVASGYQDFGKIKEFVIPGVMAYIIFIFSSIATKWEKELESPYTYMIPDSAFHKLWYATLMEHIRSLVNAIMITVPAAIALKISPIQAVLSILLFVCLQACKLYLTIMAAGLLGNLLGSAGKQILRMLILGTIIGIGVMGAVGAYFFIGIEAAFLAMIVIVCAETFACMFIAAISFEKMESLA